MNNEKEVETSDPFISDVRKYSRLTGFDALLIELFFNFSVPDNTQKSFSKSCCFHAEIILESWRNHTITKGGLLAYSGGLFQFRRSSIFIAIPCM